MKQLFSGLLVLTLMLVTLPARGQSPAPAPAQSQSDSLSLMEDTPSRVAIAGEAPAARAWKKGGSTGAAPEMHAVLPPGWLVIPFAILLVMIATGPLFYPHFWEDHYPKVAIALGAVVAIYYSIWIDRGTISLLHTMEEYISFIALLTALFVASGGILIKVDRKGTPWVNAAILFLGAIISNLIGTTGASMLLIRPFMRVNEGRLKAFHIIFFIFLVSNVGGGLTPIGDPPLFLGFLKGVPFFWVIGHVWEIWLATVLIILVVFIALDFKDKDQSIGRAYSGKVRLLGKKNFIYLGIVILSVFMDPAVIKGFPDLREMFHLPFGIREIIMFGVAYLSYRNANKEALRGNEFNFEPIKEVAYLFVGIFATMIPALQLIAAYARANATSFTESRFFWMTGSLSGVLDNAPTYLNFLSGAMGKFGLSIDSGKDVLHFTQGVIASPVPGDVSSIHYLMAISVASVFFGAMTYIGNAPNFMVKNIAEQAGVPVPSFLGYLFKYSVPVLLPVFFIIWLIFFHY